MLPVKSKYKIAKRLGAGIFEQTQTQKFAFSEARAKKERRGGRGGSDFGRQLLEKQRIRYTYGLSEKQLSNYAQAAIGHKDPTGDLHRSLEMRADSVLYRAGFSPTRRAARQAVSHGHVKVNGVKITRPSHRLKAGDKVEVREGVRSSSLYASLAEKEDKRPVPQWLTVDANLLTIEVTGEPHYNQVEAGLDYSTLFEFYSR
ncbi:MAG: 30S ribosomal protein S4 [Candidatus Pacebacteria bacterium]|nr:30S ribosomal protein S4 [Candidatus Paceibacterota bacterium]